MAVTFSGEIYVWGWNKYGQLGLGHKHTVPFPQILDVGGDVQTAFPVHIETAY